ncbi:MAG: ABC transporter ATP-binding protein [bacterium]
MKVFLDRLSKHFGRIKAVDKLTLEIEDEEFMALLGPSGCGKTTTLLTIAGFYRPTEGSVLFDGHVVDEVPPRERNIGMVFQSYALYPHMTAFDNITFPLRIRKVGKKEQEAKAKDVASLLRIEDVLRRSPGELSGGQQQRVALARALIKEPGLLLLDEPLSNLDAKLRIVMRAELKRLQKDLGITTILVTHDQVEAMTMADRIALLEGGRLQQVGPPEELYYLPANLFVAGFIGTPPMNFFAATLEGAEEKLFVATEHFRLPLPDAVARKVRRRATSRDVVLGIRPEDIAIGQGEIQGEIYVIEPLGRDTLVTLNVGGETIKVIAPSGFKAGHGEQIKLALSLERVHLFDKEAEVSLLIGEDR